MIKNVLLIGDCSGVHKNLGQGLRNLGINAVDASYGNAWRKLDNHIDFDKRLFGLPIRISRNLSPLLNYHKLINYDVVQFIQFKNNFNPRFGIDKLLSNQLIKSNKKAYLVSTGCDPYIRKYYLSGKYEFPQICIECLRFDQKASSCVFDKRENEIELNEMIGKVSGVIPLIFEYAEAYRNAGVSKLLTTIPIPVNTDSIPYSDNVVKNKLVIFHGINRIGFKGTNLISSALERVKNRYPNDVEVIIDGRMPLKNYLDTLMKTNVVIDQLYSLTYGMNAVYSMALGKVVVGGGHPEGLAGYGVDSSPMIPLQPDEKSIEQATERLLDQRKEITAMGFASRKYVEQIHHYELVAKKYLAIWESNR